MKKAAPTFVMPDLAALKKSCAELFREKDVPAREKLLGKLTDEELKALYYDWEFWARPNQKLPPGDWQFWVVKAGRGYGKTRIGAETVRIWVRTNRFVNLIGPTTDDIRDTMVEGESGILAICPPGERPAYKPSKRRLEWPNGAKSLLFTAEEPERLRGKQHYKLWCEELASWRYPESWDQAMFGLRLGKNPQAVVTTTPKPVKHIKELVKDARAIVTEGTTYENAPNLAVTFLSRVITKYEGTRLGRQELLAQILEDKPGALWNHTQIQDLRVNALPAEDKVERICIGVDPSVADPEQSEEEPNECGIVVAAKDKSSPAHFYVFDDMSLLASPDKWCDQVLKGYQGHECDRIIAEVNNGGALVEALLRTKGKEFAYKAVHAARGKLTRAEPIAALYEQRRVHHVGMFALLEDELCDYDGTGDSPNRLDALVWVLTELSEGNTALGVVDYLKSGAAERDLRAAEKAAKVSPGLSTVKEGETGKSGRCPHCQSSATISTANGYHCNQCGQNFGGRSQSVNRGPSRAEMLGR